MTDVTYLLRKYPDLETAVAEFGPEVAHQMMCRAIVAERLVQLEKAPSVQAMLQRTEASFGPDVPDLVVAAADAWEVAMQTPQHKPAQGQANDAAFGDRLDKVTERVGGNQLVAEALVYRWLANGRKAMTEGKPCGATRPEQE